MKFLLDVNALVAWRHPTAYGHVQFHSWAKAQGLAALATCAHVELGFVRVSMHVFRLSLTDAQIALAEIKREIGGFVDSAPSPKLATWATTAAKTSDAYLVQLAASAGMTLATLDKGIPGATLIEGPPPVEARGRGSR